ncbi:MAG TPA: YciI family protein, partial [Caulobacterales bacterium]|nr:YciI family protein [Caulobacterales bacterium]
MRVMVFAKTTEDLKMDGPPTPEALEAFAAMDRFTEELVQAGVFVAAAGLKNNAEAKRIVFDGAERIVTDGPF